MTIREFLVQNLEEINDIGVIHQYPRWSDDWSKFLEMFRNSGTSDVRGWMIVRSAINTEQKNLGNADRKHIWHIIGIMGLKDSLETAITFDGLVDSVYDKFYLEEKVDDNIYIESIKADVEIRMFGAVLCHFCDIELEIIETICT